MTTSLGTRLAVWWLRRKPVGLAWLLPVLALQVADFMNPQQGGTTWVPLTAGVLAGIGWQLLSPRDLVDRLTFVTALLLVFGVLQAIRHEVIVIFPEQRENWAAAGILIGLVLATRAYRSRWLVRLAATGDPRKNAAPAHS